MNQAALPVLPSFLIYVRNLLETRMKVTTYNHHARLLLPSPWSFSSNQCIRAEGADAVMKSVNSHTRPELQKTIGRHALNAHPCSRRPCKYAGYCCGRGMSHERSTVATKA